MVMELEEDYKFTFIVQDQNEIGARKTSYEFTIRCTYCLPKSNSTSNETDAQANSFDSNGLFDSEGFLEYVPYWKRQSNVNNEKSLPLKMPPKMYIKPISSDGILTMQFSKAMDYPKDWVTSF
jgi:hypothetical protein